MTPEQQRLFTMLKEIVSICEEHGLTYYTAGGTTLGAVRHGGFIPWDDDVDIMMPRDDWTRFVDIARNGGLPEGRVLNCMELNEEYTHVIGRYTDVTSCAIHYNQLLGGTPEGFVIDVFVLDPIPDEAAYEGHRKVLSLYTDLANPMGYSYPMCQDAKLIKRYAKRMEREGRRKVLSELEAELARYDERDCEYLVMRWAAAPRLFKKEIFAFPRWENFEGLPVRVPGKCSDYLVYHYGDDWMYIPEGSGRLVHDAITFLDVDYKTVQDDYLPFIDVERTRKAILNRRAFHIRFMESHLKAQEESARIKACFARRVTLDRAAASERNLDELLDTPDHAALNYVFAEFYRWQGSPELAGREEYLTINRYRNPIYIDIGDDLLRIALLNLLDTNRVAMADRFLKVREFASGPIGDDLAEVRTMIDAVRMSPSLADMGLDVEAREMADLVLKARPNNFSNRVFLLEHFRSAHSDPQAAALAEEGRRLFPKAGEFQKILADFAYEEAVNRADAQAVLEDYGSALEHTTNWPMALGVQRKAQRAAQKYGCSWNGGLDDVMGRSFQEVPGVAAPFDLELLGKKTLRLLAELDEICGDNGIDHWLGPTSCVLAHVFGDNKPALPVLDLLVPAGQLDALVSAIERQGRPDRALDCWKTNKNHLSYQVNYVDKTTTFLQLDEGTNIIAHGVKVTVTPIRRQVDDARAKLLDMLETGWEANGYRFTKKVTKKKLVSAGVVRVGMAAGKGRLARRFFKTFNEAFGGDAQDIVVRLPEREPLTCSSDYFKGDETIEFGGHRFPIPANYGDLLASWVGQEWEREALEIAPRLENVLISADLPYEELLVQLEEDGCPLRDLFARLRRIRIGMLPMANDLRIRNRAILIAKRSEDRKRIYDDLEAHRKEIEWLAEAGDSESLKKVFGPYEQSALSYLKQGLGLCPDKEYLDALCGLLRDKGMADEADRLASLAPAKHYSPLGAMIE